MFENICMRITLHRRAPMQAMRTHRLVCQEREVEMQRSSRKARSLRGLGKAIRISRALRKSQTRQ